MTSARTEYSFGHATDVIKTSWRQCLTWKRHKRVLVFLYTDHHCWCNIYSACVCACVCVCVDTSIHTQLATGDQFIVWLLVSTSHIGHHQDDCTKNNNLLYIYTLCVHFQCILRQ